MDGQTSVEAAVPAQTMESGSDILISILGEYVEKYKGMQSMISSFSVGKMGSASWKFGEPLRTLQKRFKQGRFVGNSMKLKEISKKLAEQELVVQQVRDEFNAQVAEHAAKLEKVAETLIEMFDPLVEEEEKIDDEGNVEEENPIDSIDKEHVPKTEAKAARPILEVILDEDEDYDTDVPVYLRNRSKTQTIHVKVSHHHEECEIEPSFEVRPLKPWHMFKLDLSYQYLYDCELGDYPPGFVDEKNHIVEIAYTTELAGDETVWNFFWLPYDVYLFH